jgi:C4-dicarboxylate transporter, DctQ subunit
VKIVDFLNRALSFIERWIIVILLIVMVGLAFTQVILRNVFSSGFLWADPFLRYTVLWVGFLGAVIATKEEKHFGVDFLNRLLPPRALHAIKIIVDLFAGIVAFLLMRAAFQFIFEAIGADELDVFSIPKRIYFSIIPVGFGLIAIQFVINMIYHIRDLVIGVREKPHMHQPGTSL